MDQMLEAGYRRCGELTRQYGTTYYWGALLLPPSQRRDVYSVYALCRLADDIVDEPERVDLAVPQDGTPPERLDAFRQVFFTALASGKSSDPVMAAIADSIRRRGTDPECFERFFDAMALDLHTETWPTWERLRDGYMEGSAAVIGEMMLPVLEPYTVEAREPARALGHAFQLTNFLRDIEEDLDRGRVYLPQADLAKHGADPWLRRVTPQWRAMMAEQFERNRALYAEAMTGLPMLPPASRRCVGTALVLYSRILDRIEARGYDVFSGRVRVPVGEKLGVVARTLTVGLPQPTLA
ncbi:phytoene/squalene synthase family protein [Tessaracoccus sp. ZS01]|uniref:phytoene/squalene synthase family protein n=1 Tax=Tessaracoccus sp. ZS01 TaxID=1906324 RepID=UPI00096DD12C|nr:phytoene/squalene synthase family protein [Tessaracoccus sp. ZS01]MCG6567099.1 phytoene/squalene synthase family protein [Tessaracoccus sp. ZS01]OMG57503.1 phytoene synthase [Tessaracoccus sp. ZS01]